MLAYVHSPHRMYRQTTWCCIVPQLIKQAFQKGNILANHGARVLISVLEAREQAEGTDGSEGWRGMKHQLRALGRAGLTEFFLSPGAYCSLCNKEPVIRPRYWWRTKLTLQPHMSSAHFSVSLQLSMVPVWSDKEIPNSYCVLIDELSPGCTCTDVAHFGFEHKSLRRATLWLHTALEREIEYKGS